MRSLFLTLLVLPGFIQGQDSAALDGSRFFVGFSFSPDYGDVHLTRKSRYPLIDMPWESYKSYYDTLFQADLGYTVGLSSYYSVTDNFGIESGIQISRKRFHSVPYPRRTNFSGDSILAMVNSNFTYLDVPLRLNCTFLDSKIQVVISAGIIFHYLLQANVESIIEYSSSTTKSINQEATQYSNKYVISSAVSCGLRYNISDRTLFSAEPTFRYGHININRQAREFSHLWSMGLNLGFYYRL